jgi:hypothetical protein
MLPLAVVAHALPGRTRLTIQDHRDDADFFAAAAATLAAIEGIVSVDPRPHTGSLVIEHTTTVARIGEAAMKAGIFRLSSEELPLKNQPAPPFEYSPALVMAVALGGFALWQLGRGRILPPALTLALYAADIARLLPRYGPPTGPRS